MEVTWGCVRDYGNNSTNDSFTFQICPHLLVLGVFPALLSLFTILGNVFVLFAIFTNEKLKKRVTSVLISNLAVADLLVGAVVMPLALVTLITNGQWIFSRIMCRIWISLDVICCTASIATLCFISLDRFLGVTTPIQYATRMTKGRLRVCAVVVWMFSLLVLLGTIRWELRPHADASVCDVGQELRYVTHSVVASFFVPLAIILAVYYKIYLVTKKRERSLLHNLFQFQANKSLAPKTVTTINGGQCSRRKSIVFFPLRMHYGGGGESKMEKQRRFYMKHKKSAKTLGIVVGSFIICWLPFFLLYLISNFCDSCIPPGAMHFFTWLGYANSSFNPIIYSVSMRSFRATFQELLGKLSCVQFWNCSFRKTSVRRTITNIKRRLKFLGFKTPPSSRTASESEQGKEESSLSMGSCHALEDDEVRSSTSMEIQNMGKARKDPGPSRQWKNNKSEINRDRKISSTLIITNPGATNKSVELAEFLNLSRQSSAQPNPLKLIKENLIEAVSEEQTSIRFPGAEILSKAAPPIVVTASSSFMNLKLYTLLISNEATDL